MANEFSPESLEVEVKEPELLFTRPELLMHPTLPQPLHGLNPRTLMGTKEWDKVRRNTYSFNNYHCFACGKYAPYDEEKKRFESKDNCLHAHESYEFDYKTCTAKLVEIVALCPICHAGIHMNRTQALFDKGVNDIVDTWMIVSNKQQVLRLGNINWGDWKLEYKDKKYYSKFKNREEWREHYATTD